LKSNKTVKPLNCSRNVGYGIETNLDLDYQKEEEGGDMYQIEAYKTP
jgi:hypothetical protein